MCSFHLLGATAVSFKDFETWEEWTNISSYEVIVTYCSNDPNRAQFSITASPHPPVMILSFLQQVLVASETLLLVAHPATETEKGTWLKKTKQKQSNDVICSC